MDKLSLYLTTEEIQLILAGLQELPYKIAEPILRNVIDQANSQLNQPTCGKPEEPAAES